jgi:hypothetical protein
MGYVFSREGLRRLYDKMVSKVCPMIERVVEDQEFGKCLADNVLMVDTRDELKRQRFFHNKLDDELGMFKKAKRMRKLIFYPYKLGLDCCSSTHIATHHISIEIMYVFDYLIRNVSVFGVRKTPKFVLPKKLSRDEVALAALDVDFWNRTN